tara:strand:+ start:3769 stop:4773 length:1005 start_codon:yes stop_codon:yes gene_type:complete
MASTPINHTQDLNKVKSQVDLLSSEMIDYVHTNPLYVQCLLHIKAYRDYHKEEREEFKERIEVLDERYNRYNKWINRIQLSIIFFSAVSAFIQAGNSVFHLPEKTIQFIALCISSYSALTLSVSKYYKLDDQKENMNNVRQQCAEFMAELAAREDRLNTLCTEEIWAGPPNAPVPPALDAWENERDEMYNSLKPLIQKKQNLVNNFDFIMDSQESKNLIMIARDKRLEYKKRKMALDDLFLDYAEKKQIQLHRKHKIFGRENEKLSEMEMGEIDKKKCEENKSINFLNKKNNIESYNQSFHLRKDLTIPEETKDDIKLVPPLSLELPSSTDGDE